MALGAQRKERAMTHLEVNSLKTAPSGIKAQRKERTMTHLESDLNVASFLLARGFKFLGMELVGTRYAFRFESSEKNPAEEALEYARGAPIPAREFAAATQQLKAALYAAKQEANDKVRYGNARKDYRYL